VVPLHLAMNRAAEEAPEMTPSGPVTSAGPGATSTASGTPTKPATATAGRISSEDPRMA